MSSKPSPPTNNNKVLPAHRKSHRKMFGKILLVCTCIGALALYIFTFLQVKDINTSIEDVAYTQESLERNITQLFDYTAETRKALDLPPLLYENFENPDDNESEIVDESSPLNVEHDEHGVLLEQLENMYEKYNTDILSVKFSEILEEQNTHSLAKELNFTITQKNTSMFIRYDSYIIATVHMLYDDSMLPTGIQYDSELIGNKSKANLDTLNPLLMQLHNVLVENENRATDFVAQVHTLLQTQELRAHFFTQKATWNHRALPHADTWEVFNIARESVALITLSHIFTRITLQRTQLNTTNMSDADIIHEIKDYLLRANYSTSEEMLTNQSLEVIIQTVQDATFQSKLTERGLSIVETPKDIGDYQAFEISTVAEATTIGYFAIQKNNGNFWILDADTVPISQENIFDIIPAPIQDTLYEHHILLVGSHNGLADTIMTLHINTQKELTIMSIPRDLYFNGKKINWYFRRFSPNNFNKIISQVIGIPITQYVYVDMYAFISIINIIGGIHVRLEEDLIDPTYKIKENGKITYLQYSKGDHFLNGIEALRVARSRYSTSDFDRSARQQAIIEGIQEKLRTTDVFSYFINLIKIIRQIRPLIATNFTTYELAKMAQEYRNIVIDKKLSLTIDNVLYYTFSHLYEHNLTREDIPQEEWGAYILLPRNDDWDMLKNYIKRNIM